ncbi:hypothetical protein BH11PLA1_BH11PLA1_13290 [soil metagenome]
MRMRTVITAAALTTAALLGGVAAGTLQAHTRLEARVAPPMPLIALVDMPKVFESLDERKALESDLLKDAKAKQDELTALGEEIKREAKALDGITDQTEKQAAFFKLMEKQAMAKARTSTYDAVLDQRRAEIFKRLYDKAAEMTKKIAEAQGYTLVLANDSGIAVPTGSGTEAVRASLGQRRVLYAAPSHDITDELISQLNVAYKAGKK